MVAFHPPPYPHPAVVVADVTAAVLIDASAVVAILTLAAPGVAVRHPAGELELPPSVLLPIPSVLGGLIRLLFPHCFTVVG